MPSLPTRKVQVEVEVYVSKCEICGEEELSRCDSFARERDYNQPARLVGNSCSFPSHGSVRLSSNAPVNMVPAGVGRVVSDDKSEWHLCRSHLALAKQQISQFVAEERARVS